MPKSRHCRFYLMILVAVMPQFAIRAEITVDDFLPSSDFYTIDVADSIGRPQRRAAEFVDDERAGVRQSSFHERYPRSTSVSALSSTIRSCRMTPPRGA